MKYSMPVHPCSDPRLLEVRIADYRCKGGLCRLRAFCVHDVGTVLTPAQEIAADVGSD